MNKNPPEDELDLAAEEFIKTFNAFKKAAKELMAIMESINRKRYQELKALSGDNQNIHDFLVQIMDDSGQIGERCFGIRCVADKEENEK